MCVYVSVEGLHWNNQAQVCNSSLNLPSIMFVMDHLVTGNGSRVLTCNGQKNAEQMGKDVNTFPFLSEAKPSTYV